MKALRKLWRKLDWRDDRGGGEVSVWFVGIVPVAILLVSLSVDLSGAIKERAHALDVARESARVGAQVISLEGSTNAVGALVSAAQAKETIQAYVSGAGMSVEHVQITSGRVSVEVSSIVPSRVLQVVGVEALPVSAESSAQIEFVVDGEPDS